jgi:hypothetical protein
MAPATRPASPDETRPQVGRDLPRDCDRLGATPKHLSGVTTFKLTYCSGPLTPTRLHFRPHHKRGKAATADPGPQSPSSGSGRSQLPPGSSDERVAITLPSVGATRFPLSASWNDPCEVRRGGRLATARLRRSRGRVWRAGDGMLDHRNREWMSVDQEHGGAVEMDKWHPSADAAIRMARRIRGVLRRLGWSSAQGDQRCGNTQPLSPSR